MSKALAKSVPIDNTWILSLGTQDANTMRMTGGSGPIQRSFGRIMYKAKGHAGIGGNLLPNEQG